MKARFFAIAAMVLGLASCAKDFAPEANFGGEVDFKLAVSAPELAATRADAVGINGHSSAFGAIGNTVARRQTFKQISQRPLGHKKHPDGCRSHCV